MFQLFISLTVSGISMGIIYALLAMGLILLIRAIGVLNFAQGDLLTFGAFIGAAMYVGVELPLWLAIIVSILIFAVFALAFMFGIYWPLRNTPYPLTIIVATMGLSIIIKEALMMIFGSEPVAVPYFLTDASGNGLKLDIFRTSVQWQYILTIIIGLVIIIGIFLIFEKLYAGRMMQAASQDKNAAEIIGIPTIITTAITYILAVSITALGGFMIAPIFSANITLSSLLFGAFAGVVIGGWGNIKGAIIGAFIVGFVQSYAVPFFDLYKDAAVFIIMIAFLLFRPEGLFKSKISDKA